MQEFNCFYRLLNKQITSDCNFGISKVCNMDQEAKIFKPRGTRNDFLTRSTARGRDLGSHIGRAPVCLFFVLVSNHYFSIVLFLRSSSTFNTQTSIKAVKIVTLKPFPSSTNFDPDLRLAHINCFTICLKIFAIQTTNQSLVNSCLRWLLVT